ncbi:MAG: insulinase family protein [Flavobacteriales bacterium]|jgi:predicted Zn-dependent peptidase|nr:insulinase family protein [Flavobacteriales bacterium]
MKLDRSIQPQIHALHFPEHLDPEIRIIGENTPLILFDLEDKEMVFIKLVFDAGIQYFQDRKALVFSKSMILKGTKSYPYPAINDAIDNLGAHITFEIKQEKIVLSLSCLKRKLDPALEILKEVMFDFQYSQEEFDRSVEKFKQKFKIQEQKPDYISKKAFNKVLYGEKHPLGFQFSESFYDQCTLEEVERFHKELFENCPFSLHLAGTFSQENFQKIEETLKLNENRNPIFEKQDFKIQSGVKQWTRKMDSAIQTSINAGFVFPSRNHENFSEWNFVSLVLGGFFGSRLMANIREDKGYTYGIYSMILSFSDHSQFVIRTEVGNEYVADTLNQIQLEINRLKEELISQEELDLVKNYALGSYLGVVNGWRKQVSYFEALYSNGYDWERKKRYFEMVENMTAEKLRTRAQELFANELTIVTAGG